MTNGVCDDCGHEVQIGEWPYDCGPNRVGHIYPMKLMFLGKNGQRTTEYAPPMPISPIKAPVVTRDWMSADGTLRPMKPDEWVKENAIYTEPGVTIPGLPS